MMYTDNGPNGEPPAFAEHVETIMEHINGTTVDLSWLESFDLDMIDGIESFTEYQVIKHDVTDSDSPLVAAGDLEAYAEGVGRSVAHTYDLFRRSHEKDESLFLLLYFAASLAYESGVADMQERRITAEAAKRLAENRATALERRDSMREFYDDIRGA